MALRKMDHNKNRIQSKPVAIIDLTSDDEENAVQIKKELSTAVASGRVVKQKTRIKTLVNAPTVLKSIGEVSCEGTIFFIDFWKIDPEDEMF